MFVHAAVLSFKDGCCLVKSHIMLSNCTPKLLHLHHHFWFTKLRTCGQYPAQASADQRMNVTLHGPDTSLTVLSTRSLKRLLRVSKTFLYVMRSISWTQHRGLSFTFWHDFAALFLAAVQNYH